MEIIVCVKRVPVTQEVDLAINPQKNDIRKDMLAYVINEWDNYAIEEAIQLKEKLGGTVTALTIEVKMRWRHGDFSHGADKASGLIRNLVMDSFVVSKILAQFIKGQPHDLVFTGVQRMTERAVGTMPAEHLPAPRGSGEEGGARRQRSDHPGGAGRRHG
jgi:electron transfer flavoprotein beta subunit